MTNFVPIFPLEIVVFPGEHLNLHIFEPRYRQLIKECFEQKKPFGIPAVINNHLMEYGSLVYVVKIYKTYPAGEMDIKTKGEMIFRILEVIREVPDKMYSGAIVTYPDNQEQANTGMMAQLLKSMRDMHSQLQIDKKFDKADADLNAYDIARHAGLTLQQEYEFLQLPAERQRQEYLKRHFEKALPALSEIKLLKDKIQMNGHFRNLTGFKI